MTDQADPRPPERRQAVPVRDSRYNPRGGRRRINPSYVLVVALFCVFIIGAGGFVVMALSAQNGPHPTAPGSSPSTAASGVAGGSPGIGGPGGSSSPAPGDTPGSPGPGSSPGPTETPGPVGDVSMPLVPVVSFWSTATSISTHDLSQALQGHNNTYPHVIVQPGDRDAIATALNVTLSDTVESGDLEQIRQKTRDGYLAVIPAYALTPRVKALSLGDVSLVGEGHVTKTSDWPLVATVQAPLNERWDAGATWTIVAGGDMFLDRGVRNTTLVKGMGINFPFDGGTAKVTGHCTCSPSRQIPNELVPIVHRTGNAGMVRDFVKKADLAIANLENPIPDNPSWHLSGTSFGGPPKLLPMFSAAGIDWVSLANNHMYDYGATGIAQTRVNLTKAGIPFGGAGKDAQQAGAISYLDVKGVKLGIVACVLVPGVHIDASDTRAGTAGCKAKFTVPRIQEARAKADIVMVFAHWGHEFYRDPFPSQVDLAKVWVDAGADIILGAHPHVFGGLQDVGGTPIVYSMGNFIFDQYWSTPTMESALTEITFQGTRVVAVTLHPYIVLDQAQPNFLNPATDDGKDLLRQVRVVADSLGW